MLNDRILEIDEYPRTGRKAIARQLTKNAALRPLLSKRSECCISEKNSSLLTSQKMLQMSQISETERPWAVGKFTVENRG